jgi:UDP-GlcNAc:undecaprenyl-phosphate GlcNAc-1-phosphate transferase
MTPLESLSLCFLLGAAAVAFLTPAARRLAIRFKALAHPGERHIHESPIPTWGGLAIIAGFAVTVAVMNLFFSVERLPVRQLFGLLLGAGLVAGIGVVDDRFHVAARFKFVTQIIAASLLPFFGVGISVISNPLQPGWLAPPSWLAWLLTVIWVVAVTNAINLIDGVDGLAAGVSAIACIALASIGMMLGQPALALLAAMLGGSAAGFVGWNFNPAKIFMGDTGAYFLGFIIGGITVLGAFKMAVSISIFIPLLVLAVPLLETGLSAFRRYFSGQPVFTADRNHLHHRLLAMGMSQRAIAVLMYFVTTVCCIIAVWISRPR